MDSRYFNSIMPKVNETWAAKVLKMKLNLHNGPDLIDDLKIAEVKSCLFPNKGNYSKWNILEHQTEYPKIEKKEGFWIAINYYLEKPVSKIKTINRIDLEKLVNNRTMYVLPWTWIEQFPPHETSGETKLSKWKWTFRYSNGNHLPKEIEELKVEKGIIKFLEGTNLKYFDNVINGGPPYLKESCPF